MCAASPSRNARPLAETIGDAMVHAVGREPVHALDVDAHPLDHALAHVVPRQLVLLVFGLLIAYRADEPRAPFVLQRKDREKIGRVQADVQLAVHRRAARLDIGDVKEMVVRAAGKADSAAPRARRNARRRSRRCRRLHMSQLAIGAFQVGAHTPVTSPRTPGARSGARPRRRPRQGDRSTDARARPADRSARRETD